MKKIKLSITIALLFFSTIVQAQTTGPTFSKKSSWTEITTNRFDDTFFRIVTYKIDGDTLIEDKNYSKLYANNNYFCALRETENNKIYIYFSDLYIYPTIELRMYDFDWYPGKTLYWPECVEYAGDSIIMTILESNIDSIQLLDGKYYKYVDLGTYRQIRGIGSTDGIFSVFCETSPSIGDQTALLCFYINDTLVYRNPNFNDCNVNSIDIITGNDSKIKLYPNPSSHFITVDFLKNLEVDTFKIFDLKGALIKLYEVNGKDTVTIEVQDLAKGTYVYAAILKNNQKLSGKIIIQ